MYYVYGMRARGYSLMAQPMDGLVEHLDNGKGSKYFSTLVYKRKLTEEEVQSYELDYIFSINQRLMINH